jgi:hypothetical protein
MWSMWHKPKIFAPFDHCCVKFHHEGKCNVGIDDFTLDFVGRAPNTFYFRPICKNFGSQSAAHFEMVCASTK